MTKENLYTRFKEKQTAETNEFCKKYCWWAFGQEQFKKLLDKLNLTEEQLKEQYTGFIDGGIIRKDKVDDWNDLCNRHEEALKKSYLIIEHLRMQHSCMSLIIMNAGILEITVEL